MSESTLVPCEVWGMWHLICMVIGKGFQDLDLEEEGLSSVFTSQTLLVQVATPRRLWTAWSHLILPWRVFLLMLPGKVTGNISDFARPHGTALPSLLNLQTQHISERTGGCSVSKEANPGLRNGDRGGLPCGWLVFKGKVLGPGLDIISHHLLPMDTAELWEGPAMRRSALPKH